MHNSSHVQKSDARTRVEQGVKSKTLSKQVFSTENCYVQFGVVLGLGKAIFRALLSVHYLQFCDSGAFHLTRC